MAKRGKTFNILQTTSPRNRFRFVVHLFSEGETELDYLQTIGKSCNVQVTRGVVNSSPKVLLANAFKWVKSNAKTLRKEEDFRRVWVVFDDDAKAADMAEIVELWKKCPDLCAEACKIRDRNRCEYADVLERIKIGFMTPCIEIWGLMCTENFTKAAKRKEYSLDRHRLQSELHKRMPSYVHDGHPYFEVDKMNSTLEACQKAEKWISTYGDFPDCVRASRYAGIAPLVKEILSI